jgi:deoxyinosine 3'endonuclease (endonuclease V)
LIIEKNDFLWNIANLDLVAGVDISASKADTDIACAALVIYSCQKKIAVYEETEIFNISSQPYIPGFLAFR